MVHSSNLRTRICNGKGVGYLFHIWPTAHAAREAFLFSFGVASECSLQLAPAGAIKFLILYWNMRTVDIIDLKSQHRLRTVQHVTKDNLKVKLGHAKKETYSDFSSIKFRLPVDPPPRERAGSCSIVCRPAQAAVCWW